MIPIETKYAKIKQRALFSDIQSTLYIFNGLGGNEQDH